MAHSPVQSDSILVIEDAHELNRLYCKALGASGYLVQGVASVAEAHDMLCDGPPPRIVVLDLSLADGTGLDVLDLLKDARFNQTRVVVVSGKAFEADCGVGAYHVDHVLLKPVTPRQLATLVRMTL